tara:strand:- start:1458 stop:1712 length:255 start_codon:yes stop_codon:yes gene_type:complete
MKSKDALFIMALELVSMNVELICRLEKNNKGKIRILDKNAVESLSGFLYMLQDEIKLSDEDVMNHIKTVNSDKLKNIFKNSAEA